MRIIRLLLKIIRYNIKYIHVSNENDKKGLLCTRKSVLLDCTLTSGTMYSFLVNITRRESRGKSSRKSREKSPFHYRDTRQSNLPPKIHSYNFISFSPLKALLSDRLLLRVSMAPPHEFALKCPTKIIRNT